MPAPLSKHSAKLWIFVSSLILLVGLFSLQRSTLSGNDAVQLSSELYQKRAPDASAHGHTHLHGRSHLHHGHEHLHSHPPNNVSQLIKRADEYSCKKGVPCKTEACCGSFFGGDTGTCGFGPTFCGSDCDSQCDAKPECGQYADPPGRDPSARPDLMLR